jgi:hypothetical protein
MKWGRHADLHRLPSTDRRFTTQKWDNSERIPTGLVGYQQPIDSGVKIFVRRSDHRRPLNVTAELTPTLRFFFRGRTKSVLCKQPLDSGLSLVDRRPVESPCRKKFLPLRPARRTGPRPYAPAQKIRNRPDCIVYMKFPKIYVGCSKTGGPSFLRDAPIRSREIRIALHRIAPVSAAASPSATCCEPMARTRARTAPRGNAF